jgi:beta-lactam-binding protein with PASTA domain
VKAFAFIAGLALAVFVAGGCGSSKVARTTPDVRGQRLDVAEAVLEHANLDYETRGGGFFGVVSAPRWWVCKQVPRPGLRTTSVTLIVDRSCSWSVPSVVGMKLDEAKEELERSDAPYRVETETGEQPVLESRWEVCGQTPEAGDTAQRVDLLVAPSCSVPDVEWSSLTDAEWTLDRAGIAYEVITAYGHAPVVESRWTVCDQEPAAGERGSVVSLYVARDCWADWWYRL